jgi:hypothetical protein
MELKMKKTKNAHYVDNKKFYEAMKDWKAEWDSAVEKGEPTPQCTNYLGECFVKISNHLAYKSNFVNYTFRDEMILDGIENCLRYADRFDPDKSNNPFAYFTQITYYSFVRRIKKEARQTETKLNYFQNIDLQQLLDEIEGDGHSYEYLNWVQEQVDTNMKEKAKLDSIIPESAKTKRRPLYFDELEEEDSENNS